MKYSIKSGILFAIVATVFVLTLTNIVGENNYMGMQTNMTSNNDEIEKGSPTMGSIQDDLIAYLRENHPEIRFGSTKFVDYACGVASEDIDPELKKLPNYDDIVFYCAQYLHELDEFQSEGKQPIPFVGFRPSKEFRSKTIEGIRNGVYKQSIRDVMKTTKFRLKLLYSLQEAIILV